MDRFPSPGDSCGSPYSEAYSGSPGQYSESGVEPASPDFTMELLSKEFSAQNNDASHPHGASRAPAPRPIEDKSVCVEDCFYKDLDIGSTEGVQAHLRQLIVKLNEGNLGLPCINTSSHSRTPYTDIAQPKKAGKAGEVKRPMNAFMVFAKAERRQMIAAQPELHNARISKHLGAVWRRCPEPLQHPYKKLAECLKNLHRQEHPEYKYQPRKRKPATQAVSQDSQDAKQSKKRKPAKTAPATDNYYVAPSQATNGQQMATGGSVFQGAAVPLPAKSGQKSPKKSRARAPTVQQGLESASEEMPTVHILGGQYYVTNLADLIQCRNINDVKTVIHKPIFSGDVKHVIREPVFSSHIKPAMNKPIYSGDVKGAMAKTISVDAKAATNKPIFSGDVKGAMTKTISVVAKAATNKPIFSGDVKGAMNKPFLSSDVKPSMTKTIFSNDVKPVTKEPLMSRDVTPVTKNSRFSHDVTSVINESLFSNDVKSVVQSPFFPHKVISIKLEPCMPDTKPVLCENEPAIPTDINPNVFRGMTTGEEPEVRTADEELPVESQEDSAGDDLASCDLGLLEYDNNLLSGMPTLEDMMAFTNGFDLNTEELVEGDQLHDALDYPAEVDPTFYPSHL